MKSKQASRQTTALPEDGMDDKSIKYVMTTNA